MGASLALVTGGDGGPPLVIGEVVNRFQVRRLLGSGGMGRVYLARDLMLGRSIALKTIADHGDANRVLEEARAIARLNHPNIVHLYEYGTYKSGLYLALEYVDGITLRERIESGPLEVDEILRHLRAVAEALTHAHSCAVVHCDLKPSNIMIGRDGRLLVVDFGLARTGDALPTAGGTPDYMAPEQWGGIAVTDRADSWALGIVAAELLGGEHPFGADVEQRRRAMREHDRGSPFRCTRRDVSPALIELIARSLERAPELRPPAATWKRALDDALNRRPDSFGDDAPYPGLAAFDERQSRSYFGRERELDEFIERLRETTCLPIAGPSGAGKSSFLHAGIIPRLRLRERWTVLSLRPGADPVGALAREIIAISDPEPGRRPRAQALVEDLLETPTLLAARLATLAATLSSKILVAIDQFEELFTHGASERERERFLDMLLAAADDPQDPVRVIFTIRDDFLGRVPGIRSVFVIQQLGRRALRNAIVLPLDRVHYEFDDPQVIESLIDEVVDTEGADLPLLQFACRTLWDGRNATTRKLLRATYQEMGGAVGALARHADRALAEMSPAERRTARMILLRLVSGTTRRTVDRDELVASAGDGAAVVLERLVQSRLVVQRGTGEGDGASVEIVHESLLQSWGQLARWIDESRDERRLLDELKDAAELWERRGRRSDETWPAADTAAARHRAGQLEVSLPPNLEEFLVVGERRHRRRRTVRAAAFVLAAATAIGGTSLATGYLERERYIERNSGTVELMLRPFDVHDGKRSAVSIAKLPDLAWKLYAASNNPHVEGDPLPFVESGAASRSGNELRVTITAPGGRAFLEISNRGEGGERCAPSWIRIEAFPGFSGAESSRKLEIDVPTCQASRADTIEVEAGPFIYGGPGTPPSKKYGKERDYTMTQRPHDLGRFAMDRTEVSNRAYEPFGKLELITGYPKPIFSNEPLYAQAGAPDWPVTEIDAYAAEAFCRYMGKRLPTDPQWVKAARGGLTVRGQPNPHPDRLYPWGIEPKPECINEDGGDSYAWTAPVDSFSCGASPYGIVNLVGNVQETISRVDQPDPVNPHHVIRGGGAESPPDREHGTTIFINHRDPRAIGYAMGLRCVSNH